jgi:hypothetical protein
MLPKFVWVVLFAGIVAATAPPQATIQAADSDDARALEVLVVADWDLQEKRLGRSSDSPEAIRAALERARLLVDDFHQNGAIGDVTGAKAAIEQLAEEAQGLASLTAPQRVELYRRVRTLTRAVALKNSLVSSRPILFMMRRRAVGYMLYEYLGWYYAYGNDPTSGARNPTCPTPEPGGGVYVLIEPGRTLRVQDLIADRLPPGHYVTPAISNDARRIYFAYADPTGKDSYTLPGYAQAPAEHDARYQSFHLYAMNADGSDLRQLTSGPHDDFDPCPLPDGGVAFESTRRGSKLRCGGGSPELAYTLHRMDADGRNLRTLSFHETHEWHPSVLNDGRIVYTRWDYVDRNAAKFHGLWTCQTDGSNPRSLFGNYTTRPWACYQAKAIPGSSQILFVAGGHHCNVGGTLVVLDPARVALSRLNGEDQFEALDRLTPEVCFAEAEGWPKSFFYSPWPLSPKHFLVAMSHDPLPGGYTGQHSDSETGLYYVDRFGNLELLFRRPGISAVYPIPLASRPVPPVRGAAAAEDLGEEGEFLVADVQQSLLPRPSDRRIVQLRVFQLLPKSRTDSADYPRMGHPDQANARMLLGTVPVEPDGSASFRAPARKPLFFQAVDQNGRAVQGMRTVVYLQPGERRGCVGCHEPPNVAPPAGRVLAAGRLPSPIEPGPEGTRPFCYPRLVQPILDRHCVRCHDGSAGRDKGQTELTSQPQGRFSRSYENLRPFVRWPSYDTVTRPGEVGADLSPLAAILTSAEHTRHIQVPDADLRHIYLWLDAHVPFYGVYDEQDLAAQRLGHAVAQPALQ